LGNKVPASILVAALLLLANLFVRSVPAQKAILLALLLNVTGWAAQFVGHGVFESKCLECFEFPEFHQPVERT
jgi:uncharacterized membrane protein YGL010W